MKRVTLKSLDRIAEDHNKQNRDRGDNWTWEEVIFEECLNGNDIKKDFVHMSKKETLIVMDWASSYKDWLDIDPSTRRIYKEIYDAAKDSLMERL